jgi:hypothetical protein
MIAEGPELDAFENHLLIYYAPHGAKEPGGVSEETSEDWEVVGKFTSLAE